MAIWSEVYDCYKHWSVLVIRGNNGTGVFLFIKKGVTEGDPIRWLLYGIGILPLIRIVKQEFPEVTQLWCVDDTGAAMWPKV
jgi:hypothetical protein